MSECFGHGRIPPQMHWRFSSGAFPSGRMPVICGEGLGRWVDDFSPAALIHIKNASFFSDNMSPYSAVAVKLRVNRC